LDENIAIDPAMLESLVYGQPHAGVEELLQTTVAAVKGCRKAIMRIARELEEHSAS
jgi:hypothetical protein